MPSIRQFAYYPPIAPRRAGLRQRGALRNAPRSPLVIAGIPVRNPYDPYGLGAFDSPRGLAALDPTAAANQVFPSSQIKSSAGHNQAVWNAIQSSAQAGQMLDTSGQPAYVPGTKDCAGAGTVKPAVLMTVGGLALKFAGATGPAAPFVIAGAAIMEAFGFIFGHHAAAIKREQSILCAAVPAANQALEVIDQAVQSGQVTPQQAISALQAMPTQFQSQVASIMHGSGPASPGECNAACVMLAELRAIVALKASQYQDMLSAQATPAGSVTSAVAQVAAQSGLPSWLLWAAGAYLVWEFL